MQATIELNNCFAVCPRQDLLRGIKKKLKVTRHIVDGASGKSVPVQEILEIDVRPGWKHGTRITFEGKGDEPGPGQPAGDIVFVVQEQQHSRFKRLGNDLHATLQIPLVTALAGDNVNVVGLDGRSITIPLKDIVAPGSTRVIQGEGMPISKSGGTQRGDLHVTFEVAFPKQQLTAEKKQLLRRALS